MKTSVATVSISGNLVKKLEAIAAAGFDGIEIFEQDFIAHNGNPREVGALIRSMGLEITLFQPFRDFEGLPDPLRAKAFDRAERKFDLMHELGTDLLLVCSSCHSTALGGVYRAADDFHELGERAARRGLRIGYEALALGAARERSPRCLGNRAPCGPPPSGPDPRQLSHAGPQDRS